MLTIRPFPAMRFHCGEPGQLETLCCPPYDIISDEQREAYLSANEHNIIRLELPRGEHPYQTAGETLNNWLESGVLRCDDKAGIYLYEEEFSVKGETKRVQGFISRVKLEEFSEGVVLPHEETLSKAKADRFELMSATYCNFSQIYSLYFDADRKVAEIIERLCAAVPDEQFTADDGVTHRLWMVYDEAEIASITSLMSGKQAYIADGHHRYETALAFRDRLIEQGEIKDSDHPANDVMMTLVNMENEGLVVFPTHRVVKNLSCFDAARVLVNCAEYFTVEEKTGDIQASLDAAYERGDKSFVLYTGKGAWRQLTLKDSTVMDKLLPGMSEAYKSLDVSILHTLVLERILGIDKENMANQVNLRYTRDAQEAVCAVDSGEANCAFLINPTRVSEIAAVAAAGEKMPQKSTYFYPKLITGMVMNRLK